MKIFSRQKVTVHSLVAEIQVVQFELLSFGFLLLIFVGFHAILCLLKEFQQYGLSE